MTTTNASNATVSATATGSEDTTITNAQRDAIVAALRTLHPIVSAHSVFKPLPEFDKCSEDDFALILGRASKVLAAKGASDRAERVAGAKNAVDSVMGNFRKVLGTQRAAQQAQIDAVEASTPGMSAAMGLVLSDSIRVPLFALQGVFGKDASEADMILSLRDMGYETSTGNGKGSARVAPYVRLSWESPASK